MSPAHVFVETNFLFGRFRLPSKRDRNAVSLTERHEAGEIRVYVPYLCFQEARNLIAKNLPKTLGTDVKEFHRYAAATGPVDWDFNEVQKLLDAAAAEVNHTKAVYQRELADFMEAIGEGILHGTNAVFDFLQSLTFDGGDPSYNDKLILSSVLLKSRELKSAGEDRLFFASVDKSDLQPTVNRPKLTAYYSDAGLKFIPGFVLPDSAAPAP